MSFSLIASSSGYLYASGTTVNTVGTFDIVAGDLLVAIMAGGDDYTMTIADSDGGNSFTMLTAGLTPGVHFARIGYKIAATSATGVNIRGTYSSATLYKTICVLQFRPDSGDTVTFEAGDNAADGAGTAVSSNNISITGDDIVVVGCGAWGGSQVGSSPLIANSAADGSEIAARAALWYTLFTTAQTDIDADITLDGSIGWTCDALGFKSTAVGEVTRSNITIRLLEI